MANHNQGHHCCGQTQPTKESHIETKIEGLLDKFKHELEIRDTKLEHKMEMMELKMKISLLETQQDIINKVTPRNDAPVRKSRNVENTSTRDLKADANICMEKPMIVKICQKNL
jgi:hypothetical protein